MHTVFFKRGQNFFLDVFMETAYKFQASGWVFFSWPHLPALMPCYFLQHVLPFCHITQKIAIHRSHLTLTSFQAVQASCSLALSWVQTDYHHSSGERLQGSIPIALEYVGGTDKSGQQVMVRLLSVSQLFCPGSPSLCRPSVIQKEPRSRQTRHTHIHTHIR